MDKNKKKLADCMNLMKKLPSRSLSLNIECNYN